MNLKSCGGTYKGLIGECMFKMTGKYIVVTKYWNPRKYLYSFGKYLSNQQIQFLRTNWHSLDAVEIKFNKGKRIILYEVKTKNVYKKSIGFRPKITRSAVNLYNKARKLGFEVTIALVELKEDWEYSISYLDFKAENYYVDKPKKYDKR